MHHHTWLFIFINALIRSFFDLGLHPWESSAWVIYWWCFPLFYFLKSDLPSSLFLTFFFIKHQFCWIFLPCCFIIHVTDFFIYCFVCVSCWLFSLVAGCIFFDNTNYFANKLGFFVWQCLEFSCRGVKMLWPFMFLLFQIVICESASSGVTSGFIWRYS